jgi:DNA-binding NtrC family response regulator
VDDQRTLPQRLDVVPLSTLRVEVTQGADRGKSCTGDRETLSVGTAQDNDLVLTDPTVSRYHVELTRLDQGVLVADHDSTNGVFCGPVRIARAVVPPGSALVLGASTIQVGEGASVAAELHPEGALAGLRGITPVMRRLMARVERAAQGDAPVLIFGESGTGKEVVARALHELGPRAAGPLVTVDCGALTPTLVASELFGHERGAFTGAMSRHAGAFERAQGGTVFLDEIGELPAALQATLLGVLERRTFRRVGGQADLAVDVRVLSATHHDLRADVNRGSFRLDLFYRLGVVVLEIPPLRDHLDDVPLLVEHFLRLSGHDGPVAEIVSPPTMNRLLHHGWPGNVRELRNFVESSLTMGETLPPQLGLAEGSGAAAGAAIEIDPLLGLTYKEARRIVLEQFEPRYLRRLLERAGGNVARAAREARMDRSHLIDLIGRYQLR